MDRTVLVAISLFVGVRSGIICAKAGPARAETI
jgi:hypothetical protein